MGCGVVRVIQSLNPPSGTVSATRHWIQFLASIPCGSGRDWSFKGLDQEGVSFLKLGLDLGLQKGALVPLAAA